MIMLDGVIFGLLAMFSWGVLDYIAAKPSRELGAMRSTLWFSIFQMLLLALLGIFLFSAAHIGAYTIELAVVIGLLGSIAALCFSKGLQVGNIAIIALISNAWGAVTAVLGYIFLGEALSSLQALYIVMIIAGTIFVSINLQNMRKYGAKKTHIGIEFAFASMLAWGIGLFLMSILTQQVGWFSAGFMVMIPRLIFVVAFAFLARTQLRIGLGKMRYLLIMSVLSVFATLSYNIGVSYNYTDIVAPIAAASSVITVLLAVVLIKEKLEPYQKLGVIVVTLGLVLLSA